MSSLLTSPKIQIVTSQCSVFLICVTFNNLFPTSPLNSLLLFQNMSFFWNHFRILLQDCIFAWLFSVTRLKMFIHFYVMYHISFLPRSKFRTTTLIQFSLQTPMPYSQCLPSPHTHRALITQDIKVSIWKPHWLTLILKANSFLAFHLVSSFIFFYPFYLSYLPHSRQILHSWYQACEHFGVFSFPYAHITFCFA